MAKSVPLRPGLGVHSVQIVVGDTLHECFDRMLKWLAAKRRHPWHVQGQAIHSLANALLSRPLLSVAYFIETISPLLICAAAAAFTLVGVSKLRRPIYQTNERGIWSTPFFQSSHIVIFTPHPSGPLGSTGDIWEFFPAGELGRVRIKRYRHGGRVGRQDVGDLSQPSPCYGGTVRHIGNYNKEGVDFTSRESDLRKPYRQPEAFCPAQEGLTMMVTVRIRGSCSRQSRSFSARSGCVV